MRRGQEEAGEGGKSRSMSKNKNLNRELEDLSILSKAKEGIGEKESKKKPNKVCNCHYGRVSY